MAGWGPGCPASLSVGCVDRALRVRDSEGQLHIPESVLWIFSQLSLFFPASFVLVLGRSPAGGKPGAGRRWCGSCVALPRVRPGTRWWGLCHGESRPRDGGPAPSSFPPWVLCCPLHPSFPPVQVTSLDCEAGCRTSVTGPLRFVGAAVRGQCVCLTPLWYPARLQPAHLALSRLRVQPLKYF